MAECAAWLQAKGPMDKFAIVLDAPIMKHFRSVTPWARKMVISADINTYLVTVVYPEGGGAMGRYLSDKLNPALVDFYYGGKHTEVSERWFPGGTSARDTTSELEWSVVGPAIGLILAYTAVMAIGIFFPKPDVAAVTAMTASSSNLVRRASKAKVVRRGWLQQIKL